MSDELKVAKTQEELEACLVTDYRPSKLICRWSLGSRVDESGNVAGPHLVLRLGNRLLHLPVTQEQQSAVMAFAKDVYGNPSDLVQHLDVDSYNEGYKRGKWEAFMDVMDFAREGSRQALHRDESDNNRLVQEETK